MLLLAFRIGTKEAIFAMALEGPVPTNGSPKALMVQLQVSGWAVGWGVAGLSFS